MKKLLLFALCVWILSGPTLAAATVIWTNTAGGNWNVTANWSPNQVPTLTNDVFITNNGTYAVIQNVAGNARSLTLGGVTGTQTLVMAAPQLRLSVTNVLTVNAQGVLQGGFSGHITNFGGIVVHGRLRAEGGGGLSVNGNGPTVISIGSGAALDMTTDLTLLNSILLNAGRTTVGNGEQIRLGNSSAFTNQAIGTLIFTNDNSGIQFATGGNTNVFFANQGQLRCHNSALINVPMALSGTVEVQAGQFSLDQSSSFSAWQADITTSMVIPAGATLVCDGGTFEFRPGSSLSGAGNFHVRNTATVNLNGAYAITGLLTNWSSRINFNTTSPVTIPNAGFNGSGAVVGGEDTLTFTGPLFLGTIEFTGTGGVIIGATGQAIFAPGGCEVFRPWMVNAGTIQCISVTLELGPNTLFTNLPVGLMTFTNAAGNTTVIRSPGQITAAFHNEGTVRWACTPASGSLIPIFNSGTLRIDRELPLQILFQTAGLTELAGGNIRLFGSGGGIDLTGGVLAGMGTIINGSVTNRGGTISPGASPGQINIQRRLALGTNSVVNIELAGTAPGTGFDQIIVGEHVSFGGTLNVSLANGFIPAVGTKFLIFTPATMRSGAFDYFNYPSNQVTLQLNYPPNGSVELEVLAIPLTLSPANVRLASGDTQTFTASGGTPPYTFSLFQNNSGGSINALSGLYTAGAVSNVTDIIQVTDSASATAQATARVIGPLKISPASVTLRSGQTQTFTASGGTPPYTFGLVDNNSGGTINSSSGLYTAGASGGIDAISVTDSTNGTAAATVLALPFDLFISLSTPQSFLDLVPDIEGSVVMDNVDSRGTLLMRNMTSVGLDVTIRDNDQLSGINFDALQNVGHNVEITNNPALTNIHFASLTNTVGGLTLSGNGSVTSIIVSNLASAGGDVIASANSSATSIDLGSLTNIGGSVLIAGNTAATSINLDLLATVNADAIMSSNTAAISIDLGSLTSAGGEVTVAGNTSATSIDVGLLTNANGSVFIAGNTAATSIDLGSLAATDGEVTVAGNTSATSIYLGALTTADGVTIAGNHAATSIDLGSLAVADGDVTVAGNTFATSIDVGLLTNADGSVLIAGNTAATSINLGSLESANGEVTVAGNTSATSIELGALTTADGVTIAGNDAVTSIELGNLQNVSFEPAPSPAGSIDLGSLVGVGSQSGAAASAGSQRLAANGGVLRITGNAALTNIDLGSLTDLDANIIIASNAPNISVNLGLSSFGDGVNPAVLDLQGGTYTFANGLRTSSNATLRGFGKIVGAVTNAGLIVPASTFQIDGDLVLRGSSELRLEIGGYAADQFDSLIVTGAVTLDGTLNVILLSDFHRRLTNDSTFTVLASQAPITGAFANAASGASLTTPDGYVRFTVLYAGETSVRLIASIVDTDNDGMPDWWEDDFSFSKANSADAALDFDADGASNLAEFRAGTLPSNPASRLRIVALHRDGNDIRLTWTTVGAKTYRVQVSSNLNTGFIDLSPDFTALGDTESTTTFVDEDALSNATARFYRIVVQ